MFSPARGALLACIALTACSRSKSASPFDSAVHRDRWTARSRDWSGPANAAAAASTAGTAPAPFNASDGLDLGEAEWTGLVHNPELRAVRARLAGAAASAEFAGLWDDPELGLSLQRVLDASVTPWVAGADLLFSIPLSGAPGLEKRIALANLKTEAWRAASAERSFLLHLREAWAEWTGLEEAAALERERLAGLDAVLDVVRRETEAGETSRIALRLFEIERARAKIALHHATHEAEEKLLEIKAMTGLPPQAETAFIPGHPAYAAPPEAEDASRVAAHPRVRAAEAALEEAEARLKAARRNAAPGLKAGPSFERDEGSDKAGGAASLTLPLWNRNRRAVAEAEAGVASAATEAEAALETLTAELAAARHLREAAEADLRLFTENFQPAAAAQLGEIRELASLGEIRPLEWLEALRAVHEAGLGAADARAEIARAAAAVAHAAASEVPTIIKEARHEARSE